MRGSRPYLMFAAVFLAATWTGCGKLGQVEQGLVVGYNPSAGVLTLILDSNYTDPGNPRYDRLPPVDVQMPEDPKQTGPAPDAGGLVRLDTSASEVVVYDASARRLRTIRFDLVSKADGVYADDRRVAEAGVPRIDRENGTVTLYSPRTRELATISVPADILAFPEDTWKSGDEVRYYFKNPAQALRLMNVSKTKIT